jgi:hypothetical protein
VGLSLAVVPVPSPGRHYQSPSGCRFHLPPNYAAAATFLVPLIGFAAVAWGFVPERKRQ